MISTIDRLADAMGRASYAEARVARADAIRYRDGKAHHEVGHLREAIQQYRLAIADVKQVWRELHESDSTEGATDGVSDDRTDAWAPTTDED